MCWPRQALIDGRQSNVVELGEFLTRGSRLLKLEKKAGIFDFNDLECWRLNLSSGSDLVYRFQHDGG